VPEELFLQTVTSDGVLRAVTIRLGEPAAAEVELVDGDSAVKVHGADYLDCLIAVRERLEAQGRLLSCQGARADVWPSGQLRQFNNGRLAYVLDRGRRGAALEEVDIFAPAEPPNAVSLADQRDAVLAFHRLHRPGQTS
jgi:hypothetical protein